MTSEEGFKARKPWNCPTAPDVSDLAHYPGRSKPRADLAQATVNLTADYAELTDTQIIDQLRTFNQDMFGENIEIACARASALMAEAAKRLETRSEAVPVRTLRP